MANILDRKCSINTEQVNLFFSPARSLARPSASPFRRRKPLGAPVAVAHADTAAAAAVVVGEELLLLTSEVVAESSVRGHTFELPCG